jgi:ribosomal protein S18 acetylase RimI-like enzyme
MADHPLDNPVWHALAGPHAGLALPERGGVRRYHPEIAVFAAVEHPDRDDLSGLAEALPAGEVAGFGSAWRLGTPPGFTTVMGGEGLQMVAERPALLPDRIPGILRLGPADVPDMLELVELTHPGPFNRRTIEMGRFIGIREAGRLIAMSGERMHLAGYTEVSAVCTHPDARGRGFARMLVSEIAAGIVARGETPFLHVWADNAGAIRLYEALGFATRTTIHFNVMRRSD